MVYALVGRHPNAQKSYLSLWVNLSTSSAYSPITIGLFVAIPPLLLAIFHSFFEFKQLFVY